jgi:hypothetical protein
VSLWSDFGFEFWLLLLVANLVHYNFCCMYYAVSF